MLKAEGDMDADKARKFFKKAGAPDDALKTIMGLWKDGAQPSQTEILDKMAALGAFDKHGDDKPATDAPPTAA